MTENKIINQNRFYQNPVNGEKIMTHYKVFKSDPSRPRRLIVEHVKIKLTEEQKKKAKEWAKLTVDNTIKHIEEHSKSAEKPTEKRIDIEAEPELAKRIDDARARNKVKKRKG